MEDQHRYLVIVWYIGTNFAGSQRQLNRRTVEGELIHALKKTEYIQDPQIDCFKTAARTDAKVHAREAGFCFNSALIFFPQKVNTFLPPDMGIISWCEVPLTFYPRWEVQWKEYCYILPLPKEKNFDFTLLQEAMQIMTGTHNFRLFSKTDRTKENQNTILTLNRADFKIDGSNILFFFRSQAFLWQQIRRMISFLLKIAQHQNTLDDLKYRLTNEAKEDNFLKRDKPVDPEGLILWKMKFSDEIEFNLNKRSLIQREEFIQKQIYREQQLLGILKIFMEKS